MVTAALYIKALMFFKNSLAGQDISSTFLVYNQIFFKVLGS
jgi:hypothetical protein